MTAKRLAAFTNDGLIFDVIDEGPLDAPVIIALHGFPESGGCWQDVTPALTKAGFRVLAPDQRGYSPGARPVGTRSYALDKLASDILALADQAGAAKFHVLGHDWGATLAWQLAGYHADRLLTVSALSGPPLQAFAAALPRGQALRSWYMLLFQLPKLPEWLLMAGDGWGLRKIFGPYTGMSEQTIRTTISLLGQSGAATAAINWYRARRHRAASKPARIAVPTLFVWGDRDTTIGRAAADGTAGFIDAPYRFEIFEGASHWVVQERPVETAALVLQHIERYRH
ncbi:alpha/beta fold hydrolase [Mycobacteroides chelonae]|uniref:alpha/beta fold hydrolase n=1 Tax=Mycobacteroides chelonae TaxID=1774 RepID=UPI001C2C3A0F|nr:alpha/beta fold hydrolase [Mycobacteroides chelonae]MBV0916868.1 alpha/beta fold hydrolase [Mycobacteroides chelonae]